MPLWFEFFRNCRYHVYRIIVSDISQKTRCFGLHFCCRMLTYIFNHFYAMHQATEFGEITHFVVQGHSRSPTLVPIDSSYMTSYQRLILTYLLSCTVSMIWPPKAKKIAIFGYRSCLNIPTEGFPWDDLRKIFRGCQQMAKVPKGKKKLPKISTSWVGHTNDRQTDGRQTDRGTGDSI